MLLRARGGMARRAGRWPPTVWYQQVCPGRCWAGSEEIAFTVVIWTVKD